MENDNQIKQYLNIFLEGGIMTMSKYSEEAKRYFSELLDKEDINEFVQYLIAFNLLTELMLEEIYDKTMEEKLLGDE